MKTWAFRLLGVLLLAAAACLVVRIESADVRFAVMGIVCFVAGAFILSEGKP